MDTPQRVVDCCLQMRYSIFIFSLDTLDPPSPTFSIHSTQFSTQIKKKKKIHKFQVKNSDLRLNNDLRKAGDGRARSPGPLLSVADSCQNHLSKVGQHFNVAWSDFMHYFWKKNIFFYFENFKFICISCGSNMMLKKHDVLYYY